jgi:toluene monooxygenase system protein A
MPKLKREEWFDLGRRLDWTPTYVGREELFPSYASDSSGVPTGDWEQWDEPYKVSYREYVDTQRRKDEAIYGVKSAVGRSKFVQKTDPRWRAIIKEHYGAATLAEYFAGVTEAKLARWAPSAAWRNVATLGMLDELRHAQLQLFFPHAYVPEDEQFDWAHKMFHTNEWGAIASRALFSDLFLNGTAVEAAIAETFVFETAFTNLQFLGMASDALKAGDVEFSALLQSIQTDEARHSQQGASVIDVLIKTDPERAQYLVDKAMWRTWRLFALLTGLGMDYYMPLELRTKSFKEFMEEFIIDQFTKYLLDTGLQLPWYWDIFIDEVDNYHHAMHMGSWLNRPTLWWDPVGGVSPEEREWLRAKYPDYDRHWGRLWDMFVENIRNGREDLTLPSTLPVTCNLCHLPICVWKDEPDTLRTVRLDDRVYRFCSEPCRWIFEREPERYEGHLSIADRFVSGLIQPPTWDGVLVYMGITPEVAGKDALDYSWAGAS